MDPVFKALADPTRRRILDRLFEQDGQTLGLLIKGMNMSRQAATKHLGILERAGLVVIRWQGRNKQHFLNPVPVRQIYERWVSKFTEAPSAAMTALKDELEGENK